MNLKNLKKNAESWERIVDIPISEIQPFKVRTRDENRFAELRESIRESGLKMPVGLRKLRKKKGDEHKYEC